MNNCPKCGTPLIPGTVTCPNCGEPVNNNSPEPMMAPMAPAPTVAQSPNPAMAVPPTALNPYNVGADMNAQTMPQAAQPIAPTAPMPAAAPNGMPVQPGIDTTQTAAMEMPGTLPTTPEVPTPSTGEAVPPMSEEEKKEKRDKVANRVIFIIVLIVSLVALAVMYFFMTKMFSGKNQIEDKKELENVKEYHYEGFYLYVPDDLYAEVYDGDFYIGDKENAWSAMMTLGVGTYNILVSNKSQLVSYFANMGYECTDPVEKEISGTAFVMTEVMMGTKNVLVAYTKANGTHVFGIVLENESGEYTDESLRPIGTMIASMTFEGPKYKLPAGFRLDEFKNTFIVAE